MVLQNFHAVQNVELSSPTKAAVGVASAGATAGIARVWIVIVLRGSGAGAVSRVSCADVANQDVLCLDVVATTTIGRACINSMTIIDATAN